MFEYMAPALVVILLAFMFRQKFYSLFFGSALYLSVRNHLFLRTGRS